MIFAIYHRLRGSDDDLLLFDRDFIYGKSNADIAEYECIGVFESSNATFAQDLQTGRIVLSVGGFLFSPGSLRQGDADELVEELWWNHESLPPVT